MSEKYISRGEHLKKSTSFEEQGIIGETFTLALLSLAAHKPCLRCILICFSREIKDFYQSSLGNEVDFGDIMNVSTQIL